MVRQKSIDYKESANNSQNMGEACPHLLNKKTYLDLINCNLEDENITQMYTMVKIQGSVNVNTTFLNVKYEGSYLTNIGDDKNSRKIEYKSVREY